MELVPIFVDDEGSVEGLFAVRYREGEPDEFERLFEQWDDSNFVLSYFLFNEEFLKDSYFDYYETFGHFDKAFNLSEKVEFEATQIYSLFIQYRLDGYKTSSGFLQTLFKPLEKEKKQFDEDSLQESKFKIEDKINNPQPILRLYGLRIEDNTFVITGGAIKLTHWMEHHHDTLEELNKLQKVKEWLLENDVTSQDDIKYSYYEK
ncbi:MAG TPA: hypothetical protein VKT28_10255 [Puia sp.]|nr:hypothetical protein [Puia sp.]